MGKCTIFGPHTFNFNQTVKALLQDNGAIEVKNDTELYETVHKCLDDPQFASQIASAGKNVIKQNQGATQKTVNAITKLLD